MKKQIFPVIIFSFLVLISACLNARHFQQTGNSKSENNFFAADYPFIQYTGRVDFSNPKLPRFWQPGVYITAKFSGTFCDIILQDEVLWGKNQNYLEIVVDGKAVRLQTKGKRDTIRVASNLAAGIHTISIYKNTEANIGYLEFVGLQCEKLVAPDPKPTRKIEFIGNSITCAASSDQSVVPCGKGVWQDQHNAYLGYGSITARELNAQFHLSAVSGIGLIHSCCGMNVLMPQVYDKVSMRNDTINWDFKKYQPDVVTICLGQNDGIQDSAVFASNYIAFIKKLRGYYPDTKIICLSSPMGDVGLTSFMKKILQAIVAQTTKEGDKNVTSYIFSKQYRNGCDSHPDLEDHKQIAEELKSFIREKMNW